MPRKKKNLEENLVKETAPDVETKVIVDPKEDEDLYPEYPQEKPTDDYVCNLNNTEIDKENIDKSKKMLFEQNNKKALVINKIVPKKQTLKELRKIRTRLTIKPIMSSYRGSRKRRSSFGVGFSFKVGKEHI